GRSPTRSPTPCRADTACLCKPDPCAFHQATHRGYGPERSRFVSRAAAVSSGPVARTRHFPSRAANPLAPLCSKRSTERRLRSRYTTSPTVRRRAAPVLPEPRARGQAQRRIRRFGRLVETSRILPSTSSRPYGKQRAALQLNREFV